MRASLDNEDEVEKATSECDARGHNVPRHRAAAAHDDGITS